MQNEKAEATEKEMQERAALEQKRERERRETLCKPLLPLYREMRKAEREAEALEHAISLALRAATGSKDDAKAVAALIDRQRLLASLAEAKEIAIEKAAPELHFGTGFKRPLSPSDVMDTLWRMARGLRPDAPDHEGAKPA